MWRLAATILYESLKSRVKIKCYYFVNHLPLNNVCFETTS